MPVDNDKRKEADLVGDTLEKRKPGKDWE